MQLINVTHLMGMCNPQRLAIPPYCPSTVGRMPVPGCYRRRLSGIMTTLLLIVENAYTCPLCLAACQCPKEPQSHVTQAPQTQIWENQA